jgi:hypothetical protein
MQTKLQTTAPQCTSTKKIFRPGELEPTIFRSEAAAMTTESRRLGSII